MSMILRTQIEVVGCGRTDAGVHARCYVAHFDTADISDLDKFIYQLNAVLPNDIAVIGCEHTHPEFHARFDATERGYEYRIHFRKDPFSHPHSFFMGQYAELNSTLVQEAALVIASFDHFKTFCKTGSDHQHYACVIKNASWQFEEYAWKFDIAANRFLRGMVRLIVGACLNAGLSKISIDEIREALIRQEPLSNAWSVPAHGLSFMYALYPDTTIPHPDII